MNGKGLSYSGLDDKLGNFKRLAVMLNLDPKEVWFVYFVKHFDAITAYIRGEYHDTEPIYGRILDMRNYCDLLFALVKEQSEAGIERRG